MSEPRDNMHRRGFTLVELLVVMGIIVVLITLAIPGIKTMRDAAINTRCQGNLRQVSTAMLMYSGDNDHRIVSFFVAADSRITTWPRFITGYNMSLDGQVDAVRSTQYLKPGPVFACPIATDKMGDPSEYFGIKNYAGYGMYITSFGFQPDSDAAPGYTPRSVYPSWSDHSNLKLNFAEQTNFSTARYNNFMQIHRTNSVKAPSETLLMADTVQLAAGNTNPFFSPYNYGSNLPRDEPNDDGIGRPGASFNSWNYAGVHSSVIYLVHKSTANVVFFDGHVARLTAKELNKTKSNVRLMRTMDNKELKFLQ